MIEIVVVSYNNAALSQGLSARFDASGGTIGRSDDNHLVLPDPKHHVSRFQASICSDGDVHAITNLSQANPTVLNGGELMSDQAQPLCPGDELRIGLYVLRAIAVDQDRSAASQLRPSIHPVRQRAASRSAAPAVRASASASASAVAELAPETSADAQALLQAFLDGAGIPSITLSSGMTPELMTMLGELLACAIDGTLDLVSLRALVKREVRADVTMVVVRNNNPLKFLPDGATVLTQMLRKRMPGFMGPVEAMQDAFDDLHAHQLGMMAGVQASLLDLHAQLDPAIIEERSGAPAALERLLPVVRKARLWEQYRSLHQATAAGLRTDAQPLGGAPFLRAYEKASEDYLDEAAGED